MKKPKSRAERRREIAQQQAHHDQCVAEYQSLTSVSRHLEKTARQFRMLAETFARLDMPETSRACLSSAAFAEANRSDLHKHVIDARHDEDIPF